MFANAPCAIVAVMAALMNTYRHLRQALARYEQSWLDQPFYDDPSIAAQRQCLQRFHRLLAGDADPFARTTRPGHITASAFVIDTQMRQVLLTLHAKLNLWLQLGGHADAEEQCDVQEIAYREACEESGLTDLRFLNLRPLFPRLQEVTEAIPFDIDIHQIPAIGTDTAHLHYDISFIVYAERLAPLAISAESHDLRWFKWETACTFCDPSVQRALGKLMAIRTFVRERHGYRYQPFSQVMRASSFCPLIEGWKQS